MTKNNDTALLPVNVQAVKDRIKQLMQDIGFPESHTIYGAFMQLANEFSQGCFTDRPTAPQNAEALEALDWLEVQRKSANKLGDHRTQRICETIRAALNQPRTVKPLVWHDDGVNGFAYATTPLFFYEISLNDTQTHYTLTCDSDWIGDFKTLEEAKSAAEAHWQAKIGECLV